jgi:hypothetical protein
LGTPISPSTARISMSKKFTTAVIVAFVMFSGLG